MNEAKQRDANGVQKGIDEQKPECSEAYAKAAAQVKELDQEKMIKKVVKECQSA